MEDLLELIKAYGYVFDFGDKNQNKVRYASENGFIDIWDGRKGITIGVYNPNTKQIMYERKPTLLEVEKLIELTK